MSNLASGAKISYLITLGDDPTVKLDPYRAHMLSISSNPFFR
jgi:hypothetical protein